MALKGPVPMITTPTLMAALRKLTFPPSWKIVAIAQLQSSRRLPSRSRISITPFCSQALLRFGPIADVNFE